MANQLAEKLDVVTADFERYVTSLHELSEILEQIEQQISEADADVASAFGA